MSTEDKEQFYFKGKYFDSYIDLFKYSIEWNDLFLDEETADRQINNLKKEMIMNIFMVGRKIKNKDFSRILEKCFELYIKELTENETQKETPQENEL